MVAGNVETSQVVVDALYGALGVLAASQGTMNNFTFGDARRQYYETICGGAGAGPGFDGASAVQTHMTNSRLTDPEVLERRFPVLVEDFAIRRGSGGPGQWRGGDGVVRRIRFREPMTAAILSNRRRVAALRPAGGGPAQPGRNTVERADGARRGARRHRRRRNGRRRRLRHRDAGRRRVRAGGVEVRRASNWDRALKSAQKRILNSTFTAAWEWPNGRLTRRAAFTREHLSR